MFEIYTFKQHTFDKFYFEKLTFEKNTLLQNTAILSRNTVWPTELGRTLCKLASRM